MNIPIPKCNKSDPSSDIPHVLKSTKFRVSNLCCSGEERMVVVVVVLCVKSHIDLAENPIRHPLVSVVILIIIIIINTI